MFEEMVTKLVLAIVDSIAGGAEYFEGVCAMAKALSLMLTPVTGPENSEAVYGLMALVYAAANGECDQGEVNALTAMVTELWHKAADQDLEERKNDPAYKILMG